MPNKSTREIRAAARALVEDPEYRETLGKRLIEGKAGHIETLLYYYAYGRPDQLQENASQDQTEGPSRFEIAVIPRRVLDPRTGEVVYDPMLEARKVRARLGLPPEYEGPLAEED